MPHLKNFALFPKTPESLQGLLMLYTKPATGWLQGLGLLVRRPCRPSLRLERICKYGKPRELESL